MEIHTTIIKEIKVGNNTVRIGDDHTIYVTAVGEITDQSVAAHKKVYYELLGSLAENEKVDFLVDINNTGKQSPKARKLWNEISEDKRVRGVAVFGAKLISKVIANFVMGLSQKKELRLFDTKEEAMLWLMQTKKNE